MAAHLALPIASALSYFQAIVLGALQGVSELFPISSLGHTVLFPTLFGWNKLVDAQSQSESFWLALVVMLHVGSALGLLAYFWRDWVAIVRAFFRTLAKRRIEDATERLEKNFDKVVDTAHDRGEEVLGRVSTETRSVGEKAARATKRFSSEAATAVTKAGEEVAEEIIEAGDEAAHAARSTTRKVANKTAPRKPAASKAGTSTNGAAAK